MTYRLIHRQAIAIAIAAAAAILIAMSATTTLPSQSAPMRVDCGDAAVAGALAPAVPPSGAATAIDAARDAALARVGIFAGVEESEQASTARR